MKPFTPIVVLAALFMSSTALASLDACRSMNYEFEGADYYPSPMKPNQQICVTIDGKFKKILPAPGSKLKIEVDQGNNNTDNNIMIITTFIPDVLMSFFFGLCFC